MLYALRCMEFVKLGYSSQFDERLAQIRRAVPYPVSIVATMAGDIDDEKELLDGAKEWQVADKEGREWHHDCIELRDYIGEFFQLQTFTVESATPQIGDSKECFSK